MGGHRRGPWSQSEDDHLLQLVNDHGAHNWVRISQFVTSRTPKQCRERFHQNLKPTLNHEPISAEEGLIIERMVNEMGKRWAEIARQLPGRSDNAVKNWWNGGVNRRRRMDLRQHPYRRGPTADSRRMHEPISPARTRSPSPLSSPIMLTHTNYHHQPIHNEPLPSPALTDVFRHDAMGPLSYSGSESSGQSPRTPGSPHSINVAIMSDRITLPPLVSHEQHFSRRFSLPGGFSESKPSYEQPKFAPLDFDRSRRPSISELSVSTHSFTSPTASTFSTSVSSASESTGSYHYMRHRMSPEPQHAQHAIPRLSLPPPPALLPPPLPKAKASDSRMNLSSLLS